jgi:hypothetical protein
MMKIAGFDICSQRAQTDEESMFKAKERPWRRHQIVMIK